VNLAPATVNTDRIMEPAKPSLPKAKVDHKLTRDIAQQFLAKDLYGNDYRAQAAALITIGEAAVLSPYEDPAKGAGLNIAMGYNLKHNAKHAAEDLRRAGVPKEDIPRVLAGERALTPRQAMDLTLAALPRYEAMAQRVVGKYAPDLWHRLKPAHKAVLIDAAWQLGEGNLAKFETALSKLASGDYAGFAENLRVQYRNKSGQMVMDERRNQLRTSMLASPQHFKAIAARAGG
jgi:GH24 family phage-related lysozyme (muramidase)